MKLSKKNDLSRKWRSFKKHFVLLIQPFLIAASVTFFWHQIQKHGWHFPKEDEANLSGAVVTTLGVTYGITAGLVFSAVWEKYRRLMSCILTGDKQTFLMSRDERMPIVIHMLLLTLSLIVIAIIGGVEYKSVVSGGAAVFVTSLAMAIYWVVATELENPAKSAWFGERVPKEWLELDIDNYFQIENRLKPPIHDR